MPASEQVPQDEVITDSAYYTHATNLIHNAQKEILFSTFKLEAKPADSAKKVNLLLAELISISTLIPETKVLLNYTTPEQSISKVNLYPASHLKKCKVDVRYLQESRTIHAKVLIVDSKHMITGSHNWSIRSFTRNFELSLYLYDSPLIAITRAIFLQNFETARKF